MILFIVQNGKSIAEFCHKFPASVNTVRSLKQFTELLQTERDLETSLSFSFPLLSFYISSHISL